MSSYKVAVHYENNNGYIDYHEDSHTATVHLEHAAKRQEVEEYLNRRQNLRAAQQTLVDFQDEWAAPVDNLRLFCVAMGYLWNQTGVHVDWSRPCP